MGQNTKMSVHGKKYGGKQERRKEIAQICMMHPRTFVAQTTCAHTNHFYRCVLEAMEFDGPAVICCYTTCQPEHGVADNMATDQARLAVDTRAFPLLIYDPRKGDTIKSRLSLQGNPAVTEDWWRNPKTGQIVDFIDFCRSEGRFAKHFDKDGNPSPTLLRAREERLENWRLLQELAGIRRSEPVEVPKKESHRSGPAAMPAVHGNGGPKFSLKSGTRIEYRAAGGAIPGSLRVSGSRVVLDLEDGTEIETTAEILQEAVAAGLVNPV